MTQTASKSQAPVQTPALTAEQKLQAIAVLQEETLGAYRQALGNPSISFEDFLIAQHKRIAAIIEGPTAEPLPMGVPSTKGGE